VKVEVYRAGKDDVEEICTLAERFFQESNFHGSLTLDPKGWRKTVSDNIDNPDAAAVIAVVEGKIVGYCLIYCQRDYTVEAVGEMFQFYIMPEYRGTIVARSVLKYVMRQYDEWGCVRCYAEASPVMTDERHLKMFENLWSKYDYSKVGVVMMRGI
jgi:GNAT superfamily N-acetyltransferase